MTTRSVFMVLLMVSVAQALHGQPATRVLAAPEFPETYTERYSDEGKLMTDAGEAEYQDMIAKHDTATLVLRRFCVPRKVWEQKSSKQMLDDAKKKMLAGDPEMKLLSERDFTVDGFPGRSFVFTRQGGKDVSRMDYFLLKPDLFIYTCSGKAADLERTEVRAFFASIKTMEATKEEAHQPPEPTAPSGRGSAKADAPVNFLTKL